MVNKMKKWKKIVLWTLAVMMLLVAGAGVTLVLLVQHSESFRRGILAKMENSLRESTGARIEVRDFSLRLSHLSLDLYNVVVRGREAGLSRPLLQADHMQVGLTIDSLLNRKWHVRDIIIDHPIMRLVVSRAGESNLPVPPKKSASGSTMNVFDMAIRELRLDRGEIYYNDQKTPLDAEVHDLTVKANYDPAQNKYSGTLGYDNGKIVYGEYAPVEHSLQAKFGLTAQKLTLDTLELAAGKSRLALSAAVSNYGSPNLLAEGSYEAVLVTSDFERILKNAALPAGTVRLAGQLNYRAEPNRPMLQQVSVAGNITSYGLEVKTPALQAEVRDIYAHYTLSRGNAEVSDIHARIMGGTLSGKLTIRDVTGVSAARLQAFLKDLSLDQAQTATHNASMRQAHLSGKISADADAHWTKTLDNLAVHSDATIKASLGHGSATPLNGVIHADYAAVGRRLHSPTVTFARRRPPST